MLNPHATEASESTRIAEIILTFMGVLLLCLIRRRSRCVAEKSPSPIGRGVTRKGSRLCYLSSFRQLACRKRCIQRLYDGSHLDDLDPGWIGLAFSQSLGNNGCSKPKLLCFTQTSHHLTGHTQLTGEANLAYQYGICLDRSIPPRGSTRHGNCQVCSRF